MKGLQLPLGVQLSDTASFENYHAGPNAETVAALTTLSQAGAPPLLWLFGPPGCGKTHLLQAAIRRAAAHSTCAYIPLRELNADALEGLERSPLVCLDDVDSILDDPHAPMILLRFLDQLRAHGGRCVMAAAAPPERLPATLMDLKTRFSAAAVYGIKPLSDPDRAQLLRQRAGKRGLELPEEAARYLLVHLPRGAGELLQALDALDRASLSARRRLTLPFVQHWLRESAKL